jgi:hypothetical protein
MSRIRDAIISIPQSVAIDGIISDKITLSGYIGNNVDDTVRSVSQWFYFQKYFSTCILEDLNGVRVTFEKTVLP